MGPYIFGIGNEVFFSWCVICTIMLAYCLIAPYIHRMADTRYREQRRILQEYVINYNLNVETCMATECSSPHGQIGTRHARRAGSYEVNRSTTHIQENCPICLDRIQFGVSGLCYHLFCGLCIMEYFNHSRTNRCPLCRGDITMFTACFTKDEKEAPANSDLGTTRTHIVNVLIDYNQRYLRENLTIWEQLYELPQLVHHFVCEMFNSNGMIPVNLRIRYGFLLILLKIYLLLPYDVISEAQFGFHGLLDDVILFLAASLCIDFTYRRLVAHDDYFH